MLPTLMACRCAETASPAEAQDGGDVAESLRDHLDKAAEALARDHAALRDLIEQRLRSIEEGQRELLYANVAELGQQHGGQEHSIKEWNAGAANDVAGVAAEIVENKMPAEAKGQNKKEGESDVVDLDANIDDHEALYEHVAEALDGSYEDGAEGLEDACLDMFEHWHKSVHRIEARHEHPHVHWRPDCIAKREPKRSGFLASLVNSHGFLFVAALVIFIDQGVAIYSTNFTFRERTLDHPAWVDVVENFVIGFYTLELLLKFMVHHLYFFRSKWNMFDLVVVCYSLLARTGVDLSFLRSLRTLRLAKTLRVFKTLSIINDLHIMLACLVGCFGKFLWCVVLLTCIIYIFALCFVQTAGHYVIEQGAQIDPNRLQNLNDMFGSVSKGMVSLFNGVTFSLSWIDMREALEPTGVMAPSALVFFQAFWNIAVINTVITLFLSSVIKLSQPSARDQLKSKLQQNKIDLKELHELFDGFERDGLESMTKKELIRCVQNTHVKEFLATRGIDIHDAELFTDVIFDRVPATPAEQGEGGKPQIELIAEELIDNRGFATTLDLHTLGHELKMLHKDIQKLVEQNVLEQQELKMMHKELCDQPRTTRDVGASKQAPTLCV